MRAYTDLSYDQLLAAGMKKCDHRPASLDCYVGEHRAEVLLDRDLQLFYFVCELLEKTLPAISPVAKQVIDLLGTVVFREHLPLADEYGATRTRGEYVYHTARLTYTNLHGSSTTIIGDELADVVELIRLFRAGLIWPEVSYDGPQVQSLPREFRQVWREFWALVRRQLSEWRFKMDRYASTPKQEETWRP